MSAWELGPGDRHHSPQVQRRIAPAFGSASSPAIQGGRPILTRFTPAPSGAATGRPTRRTMTGGSPADAVTGARAGKRRRARATGLLVRVATGVGLLAPGRAGAAVKAPANIISFPSRDFISATGLDLAKT